MGAIGGKEGGGQGGEEVRTGGRLGVGPRVKDVWTRTPGLSGSLPPSARLLLGLQGQQDGGWGTNAGCLQGS